MIGDEGTAKTECADCGHALTTEVQRSNAGYYLGTFCPNDGPYGRESDYFQTREAAEAELKIWREDNVKPHARTPGYHGDGTSTTEVLDGLTIITLGSDSGD